MLRRCSSADSVEFRLVTISSRSVIGNDSFARASACSRAAILKRELMPSSSFSSFAICSSSVASLSST